MSLTQRQGGGTAWALQLTGTSHPDRIGDASVTTGEWIEVRAPYDGELLGRVPACGSEQVDAAVCRGEDRARRRAVARLKRAARPIDRGTS